MVRNRLCIVVLVTTLTGCHWMDTTEGTFLFVQVARSGSLTPVDGEEGVYSLHLKDVSPRVVYFSDRPQRIVGSMPTAEFLKEWDSGKDSFQSDPPNAALTTSDTRKVIVVEISEPRVQGSSMFYKARLTGDSGRFGWGPDGQSTKNEAAETKLEFTEPSLFVDDVSRAYDPRIIAPRFHDFSPAVYVR